MKFPNGRTLIVALGFKEFDFSLLKSETGLYTRLSLGYLKIHWVKGDLDLFITVFTDSVKKLPTRIMKMLPNNGLDAMAHPGFGFSFLIGWGETKFSPPVIETTHLKILRVAFWRLFFHIGLTDFDTFWAGLLASAIFVNSYARLQEILKDL